MNQRVVVLYMLVFLLSAAAGASARDVHLKPGEIFRGPGLTVTCQGESNPPPKVLSLKQCQYWDEFEKKCLFEKTTFAYFDLECTEKCWHWDAYHKTCDYKNHCSFYPSQKVFVRRTCAKFDEYSHKCLAIKDEKIGPVVKRRP